MSSPASMHVQLAAVIEDLAQAAVAELLRLEEERLVSRTQGPGVERHEAGRLQAEDEEKLVRRSLLCVWGPTAASTDLQNIHTASTLKHALQYFIFVK